MLHKDGVAITTENNWCDTNTDQENQNAPLIPNVKQLNTKMCFAIMLDCITINKKEVPTHRQQ